ncbi:hormone receptor 4 [Bacillus rossius redtenbacheri]|uniref:hormone receptor 4 n=1 Tax=Bacillus rossius redtenbacheri TaxID=93214 RepID=UPI002FDE41EE
MTLTSSPCDLDTMSLFQDLKLKRRKVDSRCSSDGESVAETSTSSPDMAGPVSPCTKSVRSSPSPAHRDRTSPDSMLAEAAARREEEAAARAATPHQQPPHEAAEQRLLLSPPAVFYDLPSRCKASPPPTPLCEARTADAPAAEGEGGETRGVGPQVKEGGNSVFDGGGGGGPARQWHGHIMVASHQQQQQLQLQQQQQQIRQQQLQQQQLRPNVVVSRHDVASPAPQHRPGVVVSSPSSMVPPPTFWVPSQASPAAAAAAAAAAACRINGVRPELIGGGGVPLSHHHYQYHHQQQHGEMKAPAAPSPAVVRTTPTVIMGEAGGVRTMIWSHPAPEQQQQQQQQMASTSAAAWSTSSSSTSSGEETAAHLLLSLGQEQPPPLQRPAPAQPPLNMERLWAGDLTQLPASQQVHALNLTAAAPWQHRNGGGGAGAAEAAAVVKPPPPEEQEDDEQPMICMICEDKATGLHYGIITCEGCKGFFKRTVQNRRVYTCVADGNCEITKAQRNRCQYCRFKKCIEQGMVLQAVREDRMPGGRNSGAVYNLYKVKYKKHKKSPKNGQVKGGLEKHPQHQSPSQQKGAVMMMEHNIPPHIVNGIILKTALTNPSEVIHLRQRLDNTVSSSRDRTFPIDSTLGMIQTLIECDEFQDIATLRNLDELLDHKSDLSEKLCQIGDSIVYKLVQWTKRLPFYLELPVEVHTRLLTHKWHELLVLTTSAYQAIHGAHKLGSTGSDGSEADFPQEVSNNLCTLQTCLTSMMGRPITMDQLRQDVGLMVEKITHVTLMLRRMKLNMEEYVCLKVITMLNQARGASVELETIQDRYMTCLRGFVEHNFPQQPTRFHDLLVRLPEVQSAAALLLESKMFYVPFLLNSAIQR